MDEPLPALQAELHAYDHSLKSNRIQLERLSLFRTAKLGPPHGHSEEEVATTSNSYLTAVTNAATDPDLSPKNNFVPMTASEGMHSLSQIDKALEQASRDLRTAFENSDMNTTQGKWNAAEHVGHLTSSVEATAAGVRMSRVKLKLLFGKANRPSRSFNEVSARYQQKLAAFGPINNNPFPPKPDRFNNEKEMLLAFGAAMDELRNAAKKWNEEDLDVFVLPHPLLGKVTVREMLLFTIYHVQHHQGAIEKT